MQVRAVIPLLCATLMAGAAFAETVVVDGKVSVEPSTIARPSRGMRMAGVERQFGEPATRHPAVGKPPITRWDYPAFSVFFEGDRVIDAVVKGDHPAGSGAPPVASASR
ncbi:MAG: hypothetical protein WBE92_07015 [Steroidobacteraceae bacterium]